MKDRILNTLRFIGLCIFLGYFVVTIALFIVSLITMTTN